MGKDSPGVSSDLVKMLLQGAALGRRTLADLVDAAGIDSTVLEGAHERIAADRFYRLWSLLEAEVDDPNFGLHLGHLRYGIPSGHVLFAVMMNSPNVEHALRRYCRYHVIMADVVQPTLETRGAQPVLALQPVDPAALMHRQQVECIFSLIVSLIRLLTEGSFDGEVRFKHPEPTDASEHRRLLGRVSFSQPANEIILQPALLQRPITSADESLLGILDHYAERVVKQVQPASPWTETVSRVLAGVLRDGKPSLADIAKRLAVSQRSLQNKLRAEGTTYQAILDRVREELATSYLAESDLDLAELAFLLGYSDQSAFHHAFKKWTGQTPLSYREDRRAPRHDV